MKPGIKDVFLIILPILSASLSAWLTYWITNAGAKRRFREEKYQNLLYLLQGFIGPNASGEKDNGPKGQELIGKIHIQMRQELLGKTKLREEDFRYYHLIK